MPDTVPYLKLTHDGALKILNAAMANLKGGLPIVVDGHVVGAIGVGSGTGEQDLEVARAALAVVDGAKAW